MDTDGEICLLATGRWMFGFCRNVISFCDMMKLIVNAYVDSCR